MKHEWRKAEKEFYLPQTKPEFVELPAFSFFTIKGKGNPNNEHFQVYIETLYAVSYAVKMNLKQGLTPKGYFDYTVYPLEGVWDITDSAKKNFNGILNKDELIFKLMIRQPDFISNEYAQTMIDITHKKKPHLLLDQIAFECIEEGPCVQMLHLGSYDSEPESFNKMEKFAQAQLMRRRSKVHREIYLSDVRKVEPEKLRTVLRFKVEIIPDLK